MLKKRLIKYAYEKPKYRDIILPVLKKLAAKKEAKRSLRVTQINALMSLDNHVGILSAYGRGSKKENKKRNGLLIQELQKRGYNNYRHLTGSWEGVKEKSVLVPKMNFSDLIELGKVFDQDAVIYKGRDGVAGMYNLRNNTVTVAMDKALLPSWSVSANTDLYSKSRGTSFELNFVWESSLPWNGVSPLTRDDVASLFT